MTSTMWQAEVDVQQLIVALAKRGQQESAKSAAARHKQEQHVLKWIEKQEQVLSKKKGDKVTFSQGQKTAIVTAALSPVSILTGGPGCGKTFATRAIVHYWAHRHKDVRMCAPTGRAAQRLQEVTELSSAEGAKASTTIHRLLGFKGNRAPKMTGAEETTDTGTVVDVNSVDSELRNACVYFKEHPLPADAVLLDEASMMDLPLAAALCNALNPAGCQLVLVGDPDQLPPVGPGAPLRAAIDSGIVPMVDLREIFRQSAESNIVRSAHAINEGTPPCLKAMPLPGGTGGVRELLASLHSGPDGMLQLPSDAVWLQLPATATAVDVQDTVVSVVRDMLPALGFDLKKDVQVISPTKREDRAGGTTALNNLLQPIINPQTGRKLQMAQNSKTSKPGPDDALWRVGDRVVQMVNDYDTDVYNGDLGEIVSINSKDRKLVVRYPPRPGMGSQHHEVEYEGREILAELQLAFATTVHKAQGGEFPVVVIPLHMSFGPMLLTRTLLYTALTRAKQLVIVVGNQAALNKCLKTNSSKNRQSLLTDRIKAGAGVAGVMPVAPVVFKGVDSQYADATDHL
eukprot:jgi/Chrzof1/9771/Cz04g15060.t1